MEAEVMTDWTEGEIRSIAVEALGERYRRYRLPDAAAETAMIGSLARYGQLAPMAVCWREEKPELLDGFKRLAAARIVPRTSSLQARLVDVDERIAKATILGLNAIGCRMKELEEAWIVQALVREDGLSQVEVAELLERHKSGIGVMIRRCNAAQTATACRRSKTLSQHRLTTRTWKSLHKKRPPYRSMPSMPDFFAHVWLDQYHTIVRVAILLFVNESWKPPRKPVLLSPAMDVSKAFKQIIGLADIRGANRLSFHSRFGQQDHRPRERKRFKYLPDDASRDSLIRQVRPTVDKFQQRADVFFTEGIQRRIGARPQDGAHVFP
jgi:hypothetical protein